MNERIPTPIPANNNEVPVPDAIITPAVKRETRVEVDGIEINGPKLSELLVTLQRVYETSPHLLSRELVDHARQELVAMSQSDLAKLLNNSNPARWESHPHFYQALFEQLFGPDNA
ncbi:MAG TPA: hypothetical protein VGE48_01600 [Candidatus Paceibacterota bacterium]